MGNMTNSLREKCPNAEFFLVRLFLYSDWIRRFTEYSVRIQENTDQKKLRIWKLFTQWFLVGIMVKTEIEKFSHMMAWWFYFEFVDCWKKVFTKTTIITANEDSPFVAYLTEWHIWSKFIIRIKLLKYFFYK